jgi:hypothetical protein
MRLLNAKTLKLHSFFGRDIPPYAILSHRWGESEVMFQDLEHERGVDVARADPKIFGCCTQALKDGWGYVVSTFVIYLLYSYEKDNTGTVDRFVLHRQEQQRRAI